MVSLMTTAAFASLIVATPVLAAGIYCPNSPNGRCVDTKEWDNM
jgi:hypothetical protein